MTALNLGIQESGNPENLDQTHQNKISKSKSMSPKMLARSGLVEEMILAQSHAISFIDRKSDKPVE